MDVLMERRMYALAGYIVEHRCTLRAAGQVFKVSKSTVHRDVTERLMCCDYALFLQVRAVLDWNNAEKHIRGGMATKAKYSKEKITPK